MKRTLILLMLPLLATVTLKAQIQLPQPSPHATVTQTIGLTEITIDYSSPGVKGREIFGGLVPYGELWRTGANACTKITFSDDVKLNGNPVKAGTYLLATIPGETEWTIVLNSNTSLWGVNGYKQEEDVLRFTVAPQPHEFTERMTFTIGDFDFSKGKIHLDWDKTRVSFDVEVPTEEKVMGSIRSALNPDDRQYARAARYTLETGNHLDEGLGWAKTAVEMKDNWYNNYLYAALLVKTGNQEQACLYAARALELGNENPARFFYKSQVEDILSNCK